MKSIFTTLGLLALSLSTTTTAAKGRRQCTGGEDRQGGCSYFVECNLAIVGPYVKSAQQPNLNACLNYCSTQYLNNEAQCGAVNYYFKTGNCTLLESVSGYKNSTRVHSAPQQSCP